MSKIGDFFGGAVDWVGDNIVEPVTDAITPDFIEDAIVDKLVDDFVEEFMTQQIFFVALDNVFESMSDLDR